MTGRLDKITSRVLCRKNAPDYSQLDSDGPFSLEKFKRDFRIIVLKHTDEEIEFEMININVAIANAFRRIMISEVPTMAIEKVIIRNNTSVLHDEMLAHRLGLVPLKIDPTLFSPVPSYSKLEVKEDTTVVFKMKVTCKKKPKSTPTPSSDPRDKFINAEVCTDELKWQPIGSQKERFGANPPRPVFNDILLAKMRPGQEIDLEAHAVMGIGKEHAKWSPVATATYRMLPVVDIVEPVLGERAEALVKACPTKVFDIEDCDGEVKAVAKNPRRCTLCRECLRIEEKSVSLERVKNHFIFSVESSGSIPPATIVRNAISILKTKAESLGGELEALTRSGQQQ